MYSGKFILALTTLPGLNFIGYRIADEDIIFEGTYQECLNYAQSRFCFEQNQYALLLASKATKLIFDQLEVYCCPDE